jgi:hypothetical protein
MHIGAPPMLKKMGTIIGVIESPHSPAYRPVAITSRSTGRTAMGIRHVALHVDIVPPALLAREPVRSRTCRLSNCVDATADAAASTRVNPMY